MAVGVMACSLFSCPISGLTYSEEMVLGLGGSYLFYFIFLNPAFPLQFSNCNLNVQLQSCLEKLDQYILHALIKIHTILNDIKRGSLTPSCNVQRFLRRLK